VALTRFVGFVGFVGVLTAAPAAAQDVRVEVRVQVPTQAMREVTRAIASDVVPELREAIREVWRGIGPELSVIGRAISSAVQDRQDRYRFEQTDRTSRTLALGPNGSLELKNLSGEITVTAGSGKDVVVQILRRSKGRTDADAKLGLTRVTVEVTDRNGRGTVETRYSQDRTSGYSVDVAYDVTAPAGTRVSITSMSGDVTTKGIHGDLSVNVMSGDIHITDGTRVTLAKTLSGDVVVSGVETDGAVELSSMSGNIDVQQVKARRLVAGTVSGRVAGRDLLCDTVQLTTMTDSAEYSGALQKGGHYEIQAHAGTIRFNPTGPVGFELQANTFAGNIQTNLPLQLQGQTAGRGPRRSLRATSGDGSAEVVLTTFSGSVTIGGPGAGRK